MSDNRQWMGHHMDSDHMAIRTRPTIYNGAGLAGTTEEIRCHPEEGNHRPSEGLSHPPSPTYLLYHLLFEYFLGSGG